MTKTFYERDPMKQWNEGKPCLILNVFQSRRLLIPQIVLCHLFQIPFVSYQFC